MDARAKEALGNAFRETSEKQEKFLLNLNFVTDRSFVNYRFPVGPYLLRMQENLQIEDGTESACSRGVW